MKTKTINLYQFDELSEDAKRVAIERLSDINVDYQWWESVYDDAREVKLKLTEFDLDRNKHCKGSFIESPAETAELIISSHGKDCNTYKTAKAFLSNLNDLTSKYENIEDVPENEIEDLEDMFLTDILKDYASILQKACDYLQSEEAIIETIKANEYYFTEDGKIGIITYKSETKMKAKVMYYIILTIEAIGGRETNSVRPAMVQRPLFYPSDVEDETLDDGHTKHVSRKYCGVLDFDQLIQFLNECDFHDTCQTMGSLTMEYGWMDAIAFNANCGQDYHSGTYHSLNAYISPIYDDESFELLNQAATGHQQDASGHLQKILTWLEKESLDDYYDFKYEKRDVPEYLKEKQFDLDQLFIEEFIKPINAES